MTDNLADDPRWQRMMDADWSCPCCGRRFGGRRGIGWVVPIVFVVLVVLVVPAGLV